MSWEIRYYDEKLQEAVLALPAGLLARYLHLTDRMLVYGPDLGMPHTRAMGSGLFEIRLKSQEGIGRIFYCTLVHQKIVMLHREEDGQDAAQGVSHRAQALEGVEGC